MLYSELQCSEAIHKAVERMGFAEMTEVQEKTIPVMLAGRDVIAKAPPALARPALSASRWLSTSTRPSRHRRPSFMAPTRELAQQIAEELTG